MTRATKMLAGASLALALGVAGQIGTYHTSSATAGAHVETLHASWLFKPTSVKQLQNRATSIALVKVVSSTDGPDIVTEQANEPGGVDRIPTRRVTVEVLKSYKGGASVGQQLTLFQTGGTVTPPPRTAKPAKGENFETKVHQVILEDDPFYQAGEQYLVMLEAGPAGTLRTVSPEGRYRYDATTGKLSPMVKNAVTSTITSQSLSALAPLLRGESS